MGRWVFSSILIFLAILFAIRIEQRAQIPGKPWALDRQRIQKNLEALPGQHLVLVEYRPNHQLTDEWVFNGPDIPHQKVMWARAMSPALDQELVDYFHDCHIWVLDADANPAVLTPRELKR